MSDAPSVEGISLDDLPQGIQDALEANESIELSLSCTRLGVQEIRSLALNLGFNNDEQQLIKQAWAAIGRAARTARGEDPRIALAKITFCTDSPTAMSGLPPTIHATDFVDVVFNPFLLAQAQRRDPHHGLSPQAVEACKIFIGRLRASFHN
jgi:hypothetical protein